MEYPIYPAAPGRGVASDPSQDSKPLMNLQNLDRPRTLAETHEVFNQAPPLQDYNLFASDAALKDGKVDKNELNRIIQAWKAPKSTLG